MLNKGKSYINHISNRTISYLLKNGFIATDNWAKINYVDVIIENYKMEKFLFDNKNEFELLGREHLKKIEQHKENSS